MTQLIFGLILAGIVSFGVVRGWTQFKEWVAEPYVTAQRQADQKVVDEAEARAKNSEADAEKARLASAEQSAQIEALQRAGEEARAANAAVVEAYSKLVKSSEARVAALKKLAEGDPSSGRSCQEILADVDRILRESATVRSSR